MTTLFSAMFTVYKNTYSWFSTSTKFLMTVQKPDMLALCTWYRINQLYILVKSQSNLTSNLMSWVSKIKKMNINVIYIMISGPISMCIAWIFGSNICIVLTAWCREDSGKMHGRGIDKIPSRHPQTSNHSAAQILLATLKLSGRCPIQLYWDRSMLWAPAIPMLSQTNRTLK